MNKKSVITTSMYCQVCKHFNECQESKTCSCNKFISDIKIGHGSIKNPSDNEEK